MIPHLFNILALASAALPALALDLPDYRGLRTSLNNSVLRVTFHNAESPINLWNQATQDDLSDLIQRLQVDNETKAVVFDSDVPRFFVAHLDTAVLVADSEFIYSFATLLYNITNLPQVTIGAVEGRARGAGAELLSALDMRFATKLDTLIGQPEVSAGNTPGGGGGVLLTKLIGRGLAMEYILSSRDVTASEAERIGWINKAFETSKEMRNYIDHLTSRIRLFPFAALQEAKKSINRVSKPSFEDMYAEAEGFYRAASDPASTEAMAAYGRYMTDKDLVEVELVLPDLAPFWYEA